MNTLAIRLKPAAERMVKKRHPWVFDDSITKQNKEGKSGDVAVIWDQSRKKFLACGLYDADSPIRIKLCAFGEPTKLNSEWFAQQIQIAFQKRKALLATDTNAYRFIHGENDSLPGLIADVYDKVLVLKLYSGIWFPYLKAIVPELMKTSGADTLVLRLSRNLQSTSGHDFKDASVLIGELASPEVQFKEHGCNFSANVLQGHKTGFFLDHRANRKRVGELSKGKTVLDVFCYAGGFSVHALANGATEVYSVDISMQALEQAKDNAALNPHLGKHECVGGDAFDILESYIAQRIKFDVVVIDPPSFAKRKSERVKAMKAYERLARLGASLVAKDGMLLLASCSSRISADEFFEINSRVLDRVGPKYKLLEKAFHDLDHPIGFPEGAYLKTGYYLREA